MTTEQFAPTGPLDGASERSKVHAELAEFVTAVPIAFGLLDTTLRFVFVNPALAAIGSRRVEQCRGQTLLDTLPELAPALEPMLRRALQSGERVLQEQLAAVFHDGEARSWVASFSRIRGIDHEAVGIGLVEVTAHKRIEDGLRNEREQLQSILEQMHVGVVIVGAPSGQAVLLNAMIERLLGCPPGSTEQIGERLDHACLRADGKPYERGDLPWMRVLRTGEVIAGEVITIVRRNGDAVVGWVNAAPVRDERRRIVAAVATIEDITRQTRAEAALRGREAKSRLLVEGVADYSIHMLDMHGRVESWNTGAEQATGYTADEVIGRTHSVFYPQEDVLLGRPEQSRKVALERGRYEEEGWRLRKNGSRFWALTTFTRVEFDDESLGFSVIVRDVTERKLVEDALRESNRRIAMTLESISDAFCALDRDWRFLFVNAEAERLMRRGRADMIGRTLMECYPDLPQTAVYRQLERAVAQQVPLHVEERFPDDPTWYEIRAYPSEVGLSIYFRDVTEQRQAELALRVLAETGKQLTESIEYDATLDQIAHLGVPDFADWCFAAVLEDGEGFRFAVANVDAEAQARGLAMARRHPPRLDLDIGVVRVIKTGEAELVSEITADRLERIAEDPAQFAFLLGLKLVSGVTVPLRARGRTLGAIGFYSSAPGHRYGPADVGLAEEIGRRAGLAVDNARLYRESQSATRDREDMVAIATHDLRGPINTLRLCTQLLLRSISGTPADRLPEGIVDGLRRIELQAEQLAQLVDYFLDVSKIAAQQLDLQLEPVDLSALAYEAGSRVREQIEDSGCTLEIDAKSPLIGRWDRRRLEQVVNNLLGNALKFGRGKPIQISVSVDGPVAFLSVTDHGVGIPHEAQHRIFERFLRAPGARTYTGAGLGLYIVRRITEAHGGSASVRSVPGEGATFTVQLPIAGPTRDG